MSPEKRSAKKSGKGEFRSGRIGGTALLDGATFRNKAVQYAVVGELAIFEGDIILGKAKEVNQRTGRKRSAPPGDPNLMYGIAITGEQYRWPDCTVPYEIAANLANQQRVTDAIAHWEQNTNIRFVLRTQTNQSQYVDYVEFVTSTGCASYVGRQGGRQEIFLAPGCSTGSTIHEIGHAVGLWHEHSREDRDNFVTIHWDNIIAGFEHNFDQHIADGDDIGEYDYGSIMHYPRNAFSNNGDTIVPTDPNAQIGQRDGLSQGDIAAVNSLYPCIRSIKFITDQQAKFVKDNKFKPSDDYKWKFAYDDKLKIGDDKLKVADDGKQKFADEKAKYSDDKFKSYDDVKSAGYDLGRYFPQQPGFPRQPGISPFVLATPHHAVPPGFAAGGVSTGGAQGADNRIEALGRSIADLRAQLDAIQRELQGLLQNW